MIFHFIIRLFFKNPTQACMYICIDISLDIVEQNNPPLIKLPELLITRDYNNHNHVKLLNGSNKD